MNKASNDIVIGILTLFVGSDRCNVLPLNISLRWCKAIMCPQKILLQYVAKLAKRPARGGLPL